MDIRYGRKASGIKKELREKISGWLETIKDKRVQDLATRNTIVTGGSIASMLLGEKVNDYDVYFRNKETALAVAKYYCDLHNSTSSDAEAMVTEETIKNIKGVFEDRVTIKVSSQGVTGEKLDYDEDGGLKLDPDTDTGEKYRPIFLSQNAITLSHKMQIIIRFYGDPDEIHSNYDFVHAMNYYDFYSNNLVLKQEALESLLSRTLVYRGSLYPVASIFRTKKFIERGWRISAGQQLKIMWQISELDLSDTNVMREQLTGVDQAYMWQLIDALQNVETSRIDSTYVATVIDRIFN